MILPLVQLLPELASIILKSLASRLDIVDADTNITKPSVWLYIAVVDCK